MGHIVALFAGVADVGQPEIWQALVLESISLLAISHVQ